MNILPHKSWHVRTRKNIARVRKDEKEAADKEQTRLQRVALADQEAKIHLLRERAKFKRPDEAVLPSTTTPNIQSTEIGEHVNFFKDLEEGKYVSAKVNEEHVKEKKEEQEKYEKQVGYLTYLGQDTNEATGKRDWYDTVPNRKELLDEAGNKVEVNLKSKFLHDPMRIMERYVGRSMKTTNSAGSSRAKEEAEKTPIKPYESIIKSTFKDDRKRKRSPSAHSESSSKRHKKSKKKKHKKEKKSRKSRSKSPSDSSDDEQRRIFQKQRVEKLRVERLAREKVEREKADKLLAKLRGDTGSAVVEESVSRAPSQQPRLGKQKYNSQFNPEIARQNFD